MNKENELALQNFNALKADVGVKRALKEFSNLLNIYFNKYSIDLTVDVTLENFIRVAYICFPEIRGYNGKFPLRDGILLKDVFSGEILKEDLEEIIKFLRKCISTGASFEGAQYFNYSDDGTFLKLINNVDIYFFCKDIPASNLPFIFSGSDFYYYKRIYTDFILSESDGVNNTRMQNTFNMVGLSDILCTLLEMRLRFLIFFLRISST